MSKRADLARIAAVDRPPKAASLPARHVEIVLPRAKVRILPGRFRGAKYIRTHVSYVVGMGAEKGEQHIARNLGAIEHTLKDMGVDEQEIVDELRRIESAVRAELWRQVLTPDGEA
jgi:Family of unknown function (DUF6074)